MNLQHFIHDGRSTTYACGADALGRRNTRLDTNAELTTCCQCLAQLEQTAPEAERTTSTVTTA